MTLIELIKKYGANKGESTMFACIEAISQSLQDHLKAEELCALKKKLYSCMVGGHFDREFAEMQISKMYYEDSNGDKHYAPYWTENEVKSLYSEVKHKISDYNFYDFEVALNMIKSDYCPLLKRWFPDESKEDHLKRIVALTINWLDDSDNPFGNEKVWKYFNS